MKIRLFKVNISALPFRAEAGHSTALHALLKSIGRAGLSRKMTETLSGGTSIAWQAYFI